MDVTSTGYSPTFVEQVLRGITKIESPRTGYSDLSLGAGSISVDATDQY
jgi:hypothetical protein